MGSPVYNLLYDSVFFDEEEMARDYAGVSESMLASELYNYMVEVAKTLPKIQSSLQTTSGPFLSTGATLRPHDMLTQGAFYIDRVVMDDPIFNLGSVWHANKVGAEEIAKVEPPPINRSGLAWVARYLKQLTPMVAANYVVLLPVNRGRGFADDALPLPPIVGPHVTAPVNLVDIFLEKARAQIPTTGNHFVDELPEEARSQAIVSVDFDTHPHSKWYYTSSSSDQPVVAPTRDEMRSILNSPTKLGTSEWVIGRAIEYAINEAYREILAELAVAKMVNASYATESPLVFDVLSAMNVTSHATRRNEAAQAALTLKIPFLMDVDVSTLMNIREGQKESLQVFQRRLERALVELAEEIDEKKREKLIRQLNDEADAELQRLDRVLRSSRGGVAIRVATATLGAALAAEAGSWPLAALSAALSLVPDLHSARSQLRQNDWFFLWKVWRATRRRSA